MFSYVYVNPVMAAAYQAAFAAASLQAAMHNAASLQAAATNGFAGQPMAMYYPNYGAAQQVCDVHDSLRSPVPDCSLRILASPLSMAGDMACRMVTFS